MMRIATLVIASMCCHVCVTAQPPADLDPHLEFDQSGVRLKLLAEHPIVVTPTGIDVDNSGRVWAVCSHTHFRPDDYDGPEHDEVIVLTPEQSHTAIDALSPRTESFTRTDAGKLNGDDRINLARAASEPEILKNDRPKPADIAAWQQRLASIGHPVDLAAGRRVFHHASVGTCVKCHRHSGRGSAVGPDLSAASNEGEPERLLRALLQPSRDVDPQYFPRMLVTEDGHVFTGMMLRDGGGGTEFYRDSTGREKKFSTAEIVRRKELRTSMMADGLIDLLTDREIRDLLAFLESGSVTKAALTD